MDKHLILYYDDAITGLADYIISKNTIEGHTRKSRRLNSGSQPIVDKRNLKASILMTRGDVPLMEKSVVIGGSYGLDDVKACCEIHDKHQNIFSGLKDGDTLYVICHGVYRISTDAPTGDVNIHVSWYNNGAECKLSATKLAKLLKDDLRLPNKDIRLKIFICRSAGGIQQIGEAQAEGEDMPKLMKCTVAGVIASEFKNTHSKVKIFGYIGGVKYNKIEQNMSGKTAALKHGNKGGGRASHYRVAFNEGKPEASTDWTQWQ